MKFIWKNRNIILTVLAVLVVFFYIDKLRSENERLRAYLPHKLIGEKITYFDLVGTDAAEIDAAAINEREDKVSVIFLFFGSSCSSCSGMLPLWNRIGKMASGYNLLVFGVMLDSIGNTVAFSEEKTVHFNLYAPRDIEKIESAFHMKYQEPQTILYKNGEIVYLKLGRLDKADYLRISNIIKGEEA